MLKTPEAPTKKNIDRQKFGKLLVTALTSETGEGQSAIAAMRTMLERHGLHASELVIETNDSSSYWARNSYYDDAQAAEYALAIIHDFVSEQVWEIAQKAKTNEKVRRIRFRREHGNSPWKDPEHIKPDGYAYWRKRY